MPDHHSRRAKAKEGSDLCASRYSEGLAISVQKDNGGPHHRSALWKNHYREVRHTVTRSSSLEAEVYHMQAGVDQVPITGGT
mgnify:FL=1